MPADEGRVLPTPYYDDGTITIYHADCRDVLPGLADVSCTVTSPPYNQLGAIRAPRQLSGFWKDHGFAASVQERGYPDAMVEEDYQAWMAAAISLIHDASHPGASLFLNLKVRWRRGQILHPVLWMDFGAWQFREEIIWARPGSLTFNARMFACNDERIYWFYRPDAKHKWNQAAARHMTVWRIPQTQRKQHPCSFPEEIPRRCIEATTDPGDLVLDPFAGIGTTLVVAAEMGRRAIGIEREERYCELAARAIEARVPRA